MWMFSLLDMTDYIDDLIRKLGWRDNYYKIWDIPKTMLYTVKGLVNNDRNCIVELVNADSIMKEVEELTKESNVAVIFKKI